MNSGCPTKIQHRISPFGNSVRPAKSMFESLYSLLESEALVKSKSGTSKYKDDKMLN